MKKFSMVLAVDDKNWLWKNNSLAWRIPKELKYFTQLTSKTQDLGKHNGVIMGVNTWKSLPSSFRPLPQRINCILSKRLKTEDLDHSIDDFVLYFNNFDHCLETLDSHENVENIFVIGWGQLYNSLLDHPLLDTIYLTKVSWDFGCDVFFDGIPNDFSLESQSDIQTDNNIDFTFCVYKK